MNAETIFAGLLITFSSVILAYSGITFTTPGETIRFLGQQVETTGSHFIPPVVGTASLIVGIGVLALKPRSA